MSKALIFAFVFLVVIACVLANEVLHDQLLEAEPSSITASEYFRGLRVKRGLFCWGDMVRKCCRRGCMGAGCRYLMCSICC